MQWALPFFYYAPPGIGMKWGAIAGATWVAQLRKKQSFLFHSCFLGFASTSGFARLGSACAIQLKGENG